jgi:glycine/D-amino acid oxidase-like deaminating enzyme
MVSAQAARVNCLIIGDGLIGLSTALEVSRRTTVTVVGSPIDGMASTAAAGLLIPGLDRLLEACRPFFADSLSRFPSLIDTLQTYDADLRLIAGTLDRSGGAELIREADGAVDNVRLLAALRAAVEAAPNAMIVTDFVSRLEATGRGIVVHTRQGRRVEADRVVLAAGAWSTDIDGLPRRLPVRPLKGQMIALRSSLLSRAVMGDHIYLVPRDGETLVGATVEEAGFDLTVTDEAIASLRSAAGALYPQLAAAELTRAWAGIRPATPDMLPILGADPEMPSLVYACGHSKNGVLLTPGTAAAIAAVCLDESPSTSIDPFSVTRFF